MTMSLETSKKPAKKTPIARNGVDTPSLFTTIDVVKNQPELAKFLFRATNRWIVGTHSETRIDAFSGAGAEHEHKARFKCEGDHPAVLCGADEAPTPVEFLLHALASCLTAGIANIAAARGITLTKVESTVQGNIDLRGILGISEDVRNGYQTLRVSFRIEGDAPQAKLKEIVEQSRRRSAVFDVLTNGVPVAIDVEAA